MCQVAAWNIKNSFEFFFIDCLGQSLKWKTNLETFFCDYKKFFEFFYWLYLVAACLTTSYSVKKCMTFTLIPYFIFFIVFLSRKKEGKFSYPFLKTYHIHMIIGLSNLIHTLNDSWLVISFFVWNFYQKKILYIFYSSPELSSDIQNRLSNKKKKKRRRHTLNK